VSFGEIGGALFLGIVGVGVVVLFVLIVTARPRRDGFN
jgi:hypothetical protein